MAVTVDSVSCIVSTADPVMVIGWENAANAIGAELGTVARVVTKFITFYNPHSSAAPFLLRKRVLDENGEERFLRRFDKSIPATDEWTFGAFGGILVLSDIEHWYELKMDSAPTQPIEVCIDFAITT